MSLRRSFVVVTCLWIIVGLIVAVNIAINGAIHFYGPTGYCKRCSSTSLERWIDVTSHRVLDSALVFGPANGSRLCFYVDNCRIQHRNLRGNFPLFQRLHHDKRVEDPHVA